MMQRNAVCQTKLFGAYNNVNGTADGQVLNLLSLGLELPGESIHWYPGVVPTSASIAILLIIRSTYHIKAVQNFSKTAE